MTVLDAKEDSRQVEIRQERPEERRAVETLVRNAFWNQYAPGCMEHYLLHVLRSHNDFVPPLNLVAELEGEPVGQCACVKGKLWGDDGAVCTVLTLGPIAVRPDFQNRGIGKMLLARTAEIAKELGYPAIFLTGDPAYYARHGYLPAEQFGVRNGENCYAAALQVLPLEKGVLMPGRYEESGAYLVKEQAALDFDQQFPKKETWTGTPSQLRFLELAGRVRPAE